MKHTLPLASKEERNRSLRWVMRVRLVAADTEQTEQVDEQVDEVEVKRQGANNGEAL